MLEKEYPKGKFVIKFKNNVHVPSEKRYIDVEIVKSFDRNEFHAFFACDQEGKRLKVKGANGKLVDKFQPIKATFPFDSYEIVQNPYEIEAKEKAEAKAKAEAEAKEKAAKK